MIFILIFLNYNDEIIQTSRCILSIRRIKVKFTYCREYNSHSKNLQNISSYYVTKNKKYFSPN